MKPFDEFNKYHLITVISKSVFLVQGDTIKCYVGVATAHGDNKVDHLIPTTCPEDVTKCMKTSAGFGQSKLISISIILTNIIAQTSANY